MISERVREAKEFELKVLKLLRKLEQKLIRKKLLFWLKLQKKRDFRGEGESDAVNIYANAFEQDPDFYSFPRSMQAYGNVLGEDGTTMILSPDSEFLEFFNNSKGQR